MIKNAAPDSQKAIQRRQAGNASPTPPALTLAGIEITHPDKILFANPHISKEDVAQYYSLAAERMLPFLQNRIVSVVRCPGGIEGSCFYKKHPAGDAGAIRAVSVPANAGGNEDYFYIQDARGLLSEVQMNTLEFHTWGSCVKTLEYPDIMVFDLDPDEGMELNNVRQGVKDLKSILDGLSLVSYLKTSGHKGYHVVLPFKATSSWESFHRFAQNIAKTMEARWPQRYTGNERKDKRKGRIFVDWLRNTRGATSVAPYSIRAREGAPVAMPIAWSELAAVAPNGVTIKEAAARLRRKDPWENFFASKQEIK